MAETETNTEYDEFIVDSSKLSLVHKFKDKIEQMFSVIVYIDESTDQKGEKSWLRVDGQKCDRKDAREYILAVCHPQSIQKLQIKDSDKASFDDETLEDVERKTSARIKLRGNTLKILGSEISVILAMTSLEEKGAVGMEDTEADGETDGMNEVSKKNGVKNRWTSKVDLQLEKLLCNPSNNTESISIRDFTKSSPSIKMTILKCMTDMDDEVSDSDLFPSSRDEAPSYKLQVFDESDEDKDDYVDGKNVNQLTDKLTTAQISPSPEKPTPKETCDTPDVCLFRTFGKSVGYTEAEVEEGLTLCNTKTTPADFLNILNEVQEKKKQLLEKNFSDEVSIDASQKTNFPPPPDVPVALFSPVSGRRSLPNEYKERLVKDFTEETADLPVEELKKRNEERQKVLKSSFDKNVGQLSDTKSPQKKKRRKKKKNKKANPVKYIGEGSKENPAIVCSSDDDEEQTKVMAIWHENPEEASDSDDCMIVEESFPENASQKKPTGQNSNTSSNQDKTGQQKAKSSGEQWTVVGNPQKTPFQQPRFNKPPPLMPTSQAPFIQQPPFIPQQLPFNQPFGAGRVPNPGDFPQYREEGMSNNMNRLNATNPIPSAAMTAPVLGVGPVSGGSQKNLRYIVIDGSNVAMCHGCNKVFSCRGIKIVIDYFLQRGHTQITAFVPEWRRYSPRLENPILDQPLLNQMQEDGHLVFTPARRINNRLIAAYDDRFVLELAEREEGIIVSNDQYRDLMTEKYSWRKIIEERLLLFSFVKDNFMPPFDPLGRNGPNLDEFLCKPLTRKRGVNQYPALYNRERNPQTNAWFPGKKQHDQYNRRPPENHGGWVRPQYAPPRQNNNYRNQQQHQTGGGGNNPQKSQKAGPLRSKAATREIEDQLKAVFPENASKINEILQNHPSETNVEKLSNYLLNAI